MPVFFGLVLRTKYFPLVVAQHFHAHDFPLVTEERSRYRVFDTFLSPISYLELAATAQVYLPLMIEEGLQSAHCTMLTTVSKGMKHKSCI